LKPFGWFKHDALHQVKGIAMTDRSSASGLAAQAMPPEAALERVALQHLVYAYCHAADRRDFILLRSLYADDAIDDHGAFNGPVDEFIPWFRDGLSVFEATAHNVLNTLFIIDGDAAQGEIRAIAYHRLADSRAEIIAGGRYADRYQKTDGVWRFTYRSFVIDWIEERAASSAAGEAFGPTVAIGDAGANDPIYHRLDLFAADRAARR
jgi:hypothetical protein